MESDRAKTAGAGVLIDLDREVHYALKPAPVHDPYYEINHMQERGTGGGAIVRWYLLAAFIVLVATGDGLGTAIVVLAGGVHLAVRRSRQLKTLDNEEFPERSDVRHRLRVIGQPEGLRALMQSPLEPTEHFEPVIFRVVRAHDSIGRTLMKIGVIASILALLFLVGSMLVQRSGGGHSHIFVLGCIFGFGLIGSFLWRVLWPAYIRIVPGRLDVVQYPMLGRSKPRVRSICRARGCSCACRGRCWWSSREKRAGSGSAQHGRPERAASSSSKQCSRRRFQLSQPRRCRMMNSLDRLGSPLTNLKSGREEMIG